MKEHILFELESLYRDSMRITGYEFGSGEKSACIVGATRGNEAQQIYCCAVLIRELKQLEKAGLIEKGKSVMVIPCVNTSSMNIEKRFWSTDNTDINRMFPGYGLGETTQRIAGGLFDKIKDYRFGMQFVSSYIPGQYIPHVKMMKTGFENVSLAADFGLPYTVIREPRPYDTTTLNYNWQIWECNAFSLYTDSTDVIKEDTAEQMKDAVLRFMIKQGILKEQAMPECKRVSENQVCDVILENDEYTLRATKAGFFRLHAEVGQCIEKGALIAEIVDPYECEVRERIVAPKNGRVFYLCQKSMIHTNTVVGKII